MKTDSKIIKSENFSKKSLENQEYNGCTFDHCDFSEGLLHQAKFSSCTFINCNLSLVKLNNCRLQDIEFIGCKIVGAEFFQCVKIFFAVSFKSCFLQYCNFSDLSMKEAQFKGSKLLECHFTNTFLKGASFDEVDLSGTLFHSCDLTQADFSRAFRYDINPHTNKIKKAKFSLPEAIGLLRGFDITIV